VKHSSYIVDMSCSSLGPFDSALTWDRANFYGMASAVLAVELMELRQTGYLSRTELDQIRSNQIKSDSRS